MSANRLASAKRNVFRESPPKYRWTMDRAIDLLAATRLNANVLPHQSGLLMLKDVTMIHERMVARCRPIESDEKLHFILNKNHVLPAHEMRRRRFQLGCSEIGARNEFNRFGDSGGMRCLVHNASSSCARLYVIAAEQALVISFKLARSNMSGKRSAAAPPRGRGVDLVGCAERCSLLC